MTAQRIIKRVTIGIAIGVVSLYALYLAVGNILLRTRALRNIINSAPEWSIEYSSAYTLWPGWVHARDVHVRVRDFNLEFLLTVDETWVNIDLPALLSRRFHAKRVDAHGVSFRYRARMEPGVSPSKTYALPPIEGFDAVPINPYRWKLPEGGFQYKYFTFDFDDVHCDGVHEVWMQDYRLTGDGQASGAFHLKPMINVWVGPAHFELHRGDVTLGADTVLSGATGHVDMRIDTFDPRDVTGNQALRVASHVAFVVDGNVPNYAFLEQRYLGGHEGKSPVRLENGGGPLHVDLHIEKAKLAPGTLITLGTKELHVTPQHAKGALAGSDTAATFDTKITIADHEGKPEAHAFVDFTSIELRLAGAAAYPLRAKQMGVFARSKNLDLEDPFEDAALSVDAPSLELTDLRAMQRFLPKDWPLRIALGKASAHVHLDALLATMTGDAYVKLTTENMLVTYKQLTLGGKASVEIPFHRLDLDTFATDISKAKLELRDVQQSKAGGAPAWWGNVYLDSATYQPHRPGELRATVSIAMRDLRPLLATYAEAEGLAGFIRDLIERDNFKGQVVLRAGPGIDIDNFHAIADDVDVVARYHSKGKHEHGAIRVIYRGLTFGIEILETGAKPVLTDVSAWFAKQQ